MFKTRAELEDYLRNKLKTLEQVQFYCYDHTPRVWAEMGNQPVTDVNVLIEKILDAKFPVSVKNNLPTQGHRITYGLRFVLPALIFASSIFVLLSMWTNRAQPDNILILLADFEDNSNAQNIDVAARIKVALDKALDEYKVSHVRVQKDDKTFHLDEVEDVIEWGKSYNATMVIWGYYDDQGVFPHFNVLEKLDIEPENPSAKLVNLASPPDGFSFYINSNLPNQMNYLTYFTIGQIFYFRKQYETALTLFKKEVEIAQTQDINQFQGSLAATYFYMGVIHQYTNHNNKQAFKDYSKAIELNSELAVAYNNRGKIYASMGNYTKAESDFDNAIRLSPGYWQYYEYKCWWGSLSGQAAKVLATCDEAVELNHNAPPTRDSRGLARALTGDYGRAIADFQVYVEWSKENGQYESLGKQREAWIKTLQAGENPFDEETLQKLREE